MFSPLEQFNSIQLIYFKIYNIDVTLFNILLPIMILITLTYFLNTFKKNFTIVPATIQSVCDKSIEFILDLIKQQIGKEGYIFFPFIFTLFNFILGSNLLSLLPFGTAITSHLIIIMWLSLSLSLGTFVLGIYYHNIKFMKIFIPECPLLLLPMLICIEIFSYIIKSFSLAIRLSANIMAGHTLVHIISLFVFEVTKIKLFLFIIGFSFILFILFLELGVAFLQAYVFTILLCIYLKDSFELHNFEHDNYSHNNNK